jgi:replicative DNA helicase
VNAADYARVIETLSRQRQAMQVAADMIAAISAGGEGKAVETALPSTVLALDALSIDPERGRGLRKSAAVAADYLETVAAASRATPGQMLGVPTGLSLLDDMLCGLKRGGLTVLGARPSMGKSLKALHIASHALTQPAASGKRPRHNVALFSLEMGGGDVIARRIAAITGIPTLAQRRPGVSVRTYDAIAEAAREIEDQPLWIDDRPGLTAEQIRLECRRLHRAHPLDLIVVDYLQIMGRPQQQGVTPVQQIGHMTRALRALAKETGAAVLLLSQLSRALESRDDKRPTLADLRESGDIEQDADAVLLLHREAYYLERQPPVKKDKESDSDFAMRCIRHETQLEQVKDKLDIIVAKNRAGTVGPVRVRVDFARMTLADVRAEEGV